MKRLVVFRIGARPPGTVMMAAGGTRAEAVPSRFFHGGDSRDAMAEAVQRLGQHVRRFQDAFNNSDSPLSPTGAKVAFCVSVDSTGAAVLQAARCQSPNTDPHTSSQRLEWRPVSGSDVQTGYTDTAQEPMPNVWAVMALSRSEEAWASFRRHVWSLVAAEDGEGNSKARPTCGEAVSSSLPSEAPPTTYPIPDTTATVLDVTTSRQDGLLIARNVLDKAYPRLRLHIQHTSGVDLQHSRTHTFTVRLRPRGQGLTLSDLEQHALSRFRGESIGSGYHGTLRRALQEAFRAAGMEYPSPRTFSHAPGGVGNTVSVLSLYHRILADAGIDVHVRATAATVRVSATDRATEHVVHTITGDARNSLSLILSTVEAAAGKLDSAAADAVRRTVSSAALVVVLPDSGVRIKSVLRRLLNYYYGINEGSVDFTVTLPSPGVFVSSVVVPIPFATTTTTTAAAAECSGTAAPVSPLVHTAETTASLSPPWTDDSVLTCTLGTASSTSKRAAKRLAAVAVLREHFPSVFAEQLEHHPEVQELLHSMPTQGRDVCPPVSRGLKVVLDWAVQQENQQHDGSGTQSAVKLSFLSRRLPVGYHQTETNQRASAIVWETQLTISGDSPDGTGTRPAAQPLRVAAIAHKKARSEQKAFAAALSQRYKHLCPEAVSFAVGSGLIQAEDGAPVACSAMVAAGDFPAGATRMGNADVLAQAAVSDPLLASLRLVPRQTFELPTATDKPVLERLRLRARESVVGGDGDLSVLPTTSGEAAPPPATRLVEAVTRDAGDLIYTARLLVVREAYGTNPTAQSPPAVEVARARHRYKVCALLGAYQAFLQKPPQPTVDGDAVAVSPSLPEIWDELPTTLPPTRPLETTVLALRNLYGADPTLHVYVDRGRVRAELWGTVRVPADTPGDAACDVTTVLAGDNNEEAWFLAKGAAPALQEAALQCAHNAFDTHIRPLRGLFRGRRLRHVAFPLHPDPTSLLGQLTGAVLAEIQASNGSTQAASCDADIRVHYHENDASDAGESATVDVVFSAVTEVKRVELERVREGSLVAAACELCGCVAKEINLPFAPKVLTGPQVSYAQHLSHLIKTILGLAVTVETAFEQNQWHCRVSLPINNRGTRTGTAVSEGPEEEVTYFVCLGSGVASQKKEAAEQVCRSILSTQFPPSVVEHIPGVDTSDSRTEKGQARESTHRYVYTLT